ncbi:hypothetical protein GCM10011510_17810 [Streptococcus himalayensis]|uniref:Uncharacterized protein n=1 Tax=Streptococcus himalayensis TaxID=1888195 RepID=A0A917A9K5_9STRE|nr:hypothetical protein GCM10011510_17810 [Streptococcus himalayensis]
MNFQKLNDIADRQEVNTEDFEVIDFYHECRKRTNSVAFAVLHVFQMGKIAGIRQERKRKNDNI